MNLPLFTATRLFESLLETDCITVEDKAMVRQMLSSINDGREVLIQAKRPRDRDSKYRHSGRTTRLVDENIQRLFENGIIEPQDHYHSRESDRHLMWLILRRLTIEHGLRAGEHLHVTQRTITLKQKGDNV